MAGEEKPLSVCLTFDFDALSLWVGSFKSTNPSQISRGEFGAFALPRILELLGRQEIRATFFVPGHTALAYPQLVCRIRDDGHEIGHHGWVHENPADLDAAGERDVFERGLDALDRAAGVRPRGYRAPGCVLTANTPDILLEHGIVYGSNCCATDFWAYYLRKGDRWSTDAPYEFGEPVELVEIPVSVLLNDFPYFEGFSTGALHPPSLVREIWQGEFDYARANCPGGVYDLCMHPQVIGRGSRLTMLEQFVEYMRSRGDVLFEPAIDYAERWKAAHPLEQPAPV
jgi:peptidoglycan/xylan/chitin deacetylase (PgdA/CDA1 family)